MYMGALSIVQDTVPPLYVHCAACYAVSFFRWVGCHPTFFIKNIPLSCIYQKLFVILHRKIDFTMEDNFAMQLFEGKIVPLLKDKDK